MIYQDYIVYVFKNYYISILIFIRNLMLYMKKKTGYNLHNSLHTIA